MIRIITRIIRKENDNNDKFLAEVYSDQDSKGLLMLVGTIDNIELYKLLKKIIDERKEMKKELDDAMTYILRIEQEKIYYGPH